MPSRSSQARRPRADRRGWGIVAAPVIQFTLVGAAALAIVALALSVASRRVGEREATVEAGSEALVKAQGLVEPALTDAPSGSFSVRKVLPNKAGTDTVTTVSRNAATGQTCTVTARL